MNAFYKLLDAKQKCSFRVDYPYYGLFGTAEVTLVRSENDHLYECKLRNGKIIILKKDQQKWLDTTSKEETALSNVIGSSIDEYLKK